MMMWLVLALGIAIVFLGASAFFRSVQRLSVLIGERGVLMTLESPPTRINSDFLVKAAVAYMFKAAAALVLGSLVILAALPEPIPADRTLGLVLIGGSAAVLVFIVNLVLWMEANADRRKREHYAREFKKRGDLLEGFGEPGTYAEADRPARRRDLHDAREELKRHLEEIKGLLGDRRRKDANE